MAAELERVRGELAIAQKALRRLDEAQSQASVRETALQHELQHRVRNMLATIRAVFSRTVEMADTLQEAGDHFSGRLETLARYQSTFVRGPHATIDFETLLRDELLAFGFGDGDQVTISGPSVRLPHGVVEVIGLAVHELATNSVKFGALSAHEGHLDVRWDTAIEGHGGLAIDWAETGVPVTADAALHTGFGRDYIECGLAYQLDAETSFELRPEGLLCRIVLSQKVLEAGR